ncbi:MAG TPA: hypothetical protein VGI00_07230 [Streptosporangiaceae bacterium]|jgi:hypothetical protein
MPTNERPATAGTSPVAGERAVRRGDQTSANANANANNTAGRLVLSVAGILLTAIAAILLASGGTRLVVTC